MWLLLVSFSVSLAAALWVVRSPGALEALAGDHDLSGPQKFHAHPVPRVGGVAIFAGVLAGAALAVQLEPPLAPLFGALLGASLPTFLAGVAEDLTKSQSVRRRLLFTAVSAAVAAVIVDGVIVRTDIPGLDWLVSSPTGALIVTVFVVTGVANAVNIIDGFNGLASMCVALMLAGLTYVAFSVGDRQIAWMALVGIGALLGFFVLNFPAGLIFLGDGGAYFLGFYLAELAILLLYRNPGVSPMFPLLLCIYPVFETLFSIYRRRWLRGRPVGMPDGAHLHSLIYRRFMRWAAHNVTARELVRRNSMTSPYLWLLCSLSVVPAMLFYDSTPIQAACIVAFSVTYVALYWRIVRFQSPRWFALRHRRHRG